MTKMQAICQFLQLLGALLREKMVEAASGKFICIVDESKLSSKGLGPGFPLPVEIAPFCHEHTRRVIENLPSVKGTICCYFHVEWIYSGRLFAAGLFFSVLCEGW